MASPVPPGLDPRRRRPKSAPMPPAAATRNDGATGADADSLSMLDCYRDLASWQRPVRLQAARQLIEQVQMAQKDSPQDVCEDLAYAVDRLTFGLASGTDGVRQGYATVLAELLRLFPVVQLQSVLRVVDTKMVASLVDEEKQVYFGRVFAVLVLLRSGRLATAGVERKLVLQQCAMQLSSLLDKKSYLAELCAHSLVELMHQLHGVREFQEVVLPVVIKHQPSLFNVAPDDCTPESLALLLVAQQLFKLDPASFGNSEWGTGDMAASASNIALMEHALKTSSSCHPRVHFVWKLVLDRAAAAGQQRTLWNCVDQMLFASHVDNRKYLAFHLLVECIGRAQSAPELMALLAAPNTAKSLLTHSLHQKKSKMGAVAAWALRALTTRANADAQLSLALAKALLSPTSTLHALAPLDLSNHVLLALPPAPAVALLRDLAARSVVAASHSVDKEALETLFTVLRRGWKRWATAADEASDTMRELAEQAQAVLRLFGRLAFMDRERLAGGKVPAEYELLERVHDLAPGDELRAWAKQRCTALLVELETTNRTQSMALAQWMLPYSSAGRHADVAKAVRALGKAQRKCGDERYLGAFGKAMGLVALRLLDDAATETGETQELLALGADLKQAFTEFRRAGEDLGARNKAVLVLVSGLIQLLSTPSLLHRAVVSNVFRMIAPVVPATGIHDIAGVIVAGGDDVGDEEDVVEAEEEEGAGGDEEHDGHSHSDEDHGEGRRRAHAHHEHAGAAKKKARRQREDEDDEDDHDSGEQWSDVEGGVELPPIALDDADPEYLAMVDQKLAAVFRALRDESVGKKAAGRNDVEFKLRVVDLLEHFARALPRIATLDPPPFASGAEDDNSAVVFVVLPQLVEKLRVTQHSKALATLNHKLTRVVVQTLCGLREWPRVAAHAVAVNAALRQLLALVARGNPSAYLLSVVERAVPFLIKVLSREGVLDMDSLRAGFIQVVAFAATKKHLAALNIERFLLDIWKRSPEAGLRVLPELAEAASAAAWSQVARTRVLGAMASLVATHGKVCLLKDATLALPAVRSVERMLLAWLRFEATAPADAKPPKVAVLAGNLAHLISAARVLTDARVLGPRYTQATVCDAFEQRSQLAEALAKLRARHTTIANAPKVQAQATRFLALLGVTTDGLPTPKPVKPAAE